jgi:hypothetical protein
MNDKPKRPSEKEPSALSREIGAKAARKLKARRNPRRASGMAWA